MTEELNRRHNLATIPTINNNGESYIVPFDIYKEGYEAYDISNWFKGRVGDNGTPFGIRWYKHGQLMDVTGMRPFIEGQVGDYTIDDSDPDDPKIIMDSEASNVHVVGEVNDCQEYGVAIYRLINQAMPQSGIFYGKIGVMGTQDDGTTVMSSVDVVFKVLAGHMNMLGARKFYVSELEKAWLDLQARIKKYQAEYKDATDKQAEQFKEDTEKALADLNTKISNEIKRAEDTLGDTQAAIDSNLASLKSISVSAGAIKAQIDRQDIVTVDRFDDVTEGLTKSINSKLSEISTTVPWLKDSSEIKKTYPNGYSGVVIAADTMHKWLYYDGQWNDAGLYSETIAKDGDIVAYLDEGKTITWNPYSIDCELDLSNMTTGITIRGAKNTSFTKEDVYKAFSSSPYTKLNGNIVTGESFALVYYFSTNKLGVMSPKDELATADSKILFLHHYKSVNDGLLVNPQDANQLKELQFKAANAPFAYVAKGKDLSYDYSSNDCNLKFNGDWVEVYYNQVKYDVKVSDILEAARKSKVVTVTDDNVIKGQQFILYFDSKDGSVHFTDREDGVPIDGYTLLEHEYYSYTGGPLVDYHVNFQALKLLEFMQNYKDTIQNYKDTKEVPDYFKENLAEGIDRVNQNMGEAGPNSLSFLFITDMHWENNAKHSPLLVHEVMKRTGLPLMINGGDLINQGEKTAMQKSLTEALDTVQYPGTFMATVRGNHDNNWNDWGGQRNHPEFKFTYNDVYGYEFAYMMRNKNLVDDFHYLNLGNDFTYTFTISDASNKKWRFICVDTLDFTSGTNINVNSSKKICDLLMASKGENIIFVAHIYNDNHKHTDFEQDLEKIVDARNAQGVTTVSWGSIDFSASDPTSKVIACFGGHEHEDYDWTTPKGVPFILTDSDNAPRTETTKYGHEYGTVGEQCFDIMTINPSTKTIKAVRIGRGIDRQFTF